MSRHASLIEHERAVRARAMTDFSAYAASCLKIRSKAGAVLPLRLNRTQVALHGRLEGQRERTGKVRALVLKGRQVGVSTYIAGRYYWRISHSRGFRAFILAHLDIAADNLFGIAKNYHDNCPEMFRPATGSSNAKELTFPLLACGYKVATAGSKDIGRSETIQLFHGSEMAFWPNAEMHAAGIQQSIADAPGTEDVRESTANGIGGAFHALWKAAERRDSEFEAIFLPWFWHEEYAKAPPPEWTVPPEWTGYGELWQLNRDQIYWAYSKSRDICTLAGGNPEAVNWRFRQEYPATAEEAFQSSGLSMFIAPETVLKARKAPQVEGYGPIILGVDPARGGGDKTAIIDRQGRRMGAHVAKRIDLSDLMAVAGEIQEVVRRISPAKVVIDTTGLGAGLYDRLRETLGDLVEGVNFSAQAHRRQHYANRRAEIWDLLRQWFDDPAGVQVPDSDELQGDLCAPVRGAGATQFNSAGQLILESKDRIRSRMGFSPDLGDAAALTFAVDLSLARPVDWTWNAPASSHWMGA